MSGRVEGMFGDPEFLAKLAYFDLMAKQIIAGARRGERRTKKAGTGTLFKDHRSYSLGDDVRYLDWNIYGRLGSLFVKQFEVEESANVHVFLDRSLSMGFGDPSKLAYARRVAAALGYIGLSHLDRVTAIAVPGGEPRTFTGKRQAIPYFEHLLSFEPEGETDLLDSVQRSLAGARRGGVAILISDLYDTRGHEPAIDFLLHRHFRAFVIQIVSPEEADPGARGSLRLVDAESGRARRLRLTDDLLAAYRESFRLFCARAERYAREKEIGFARVRTDLPYGEAVLAILRRGGVIR